MRLYPCQSKRKRLPCQSLETRWYHCRIRRYCRRFSYYALGRSLSANRGK
ncbi:MAG: hypothetical protein GX786_10440 [Clostridiales bacterium]|nr:hypothetical protein [Clostridiales bacterium]